MKRYTLFLAGLFLITGGSSANASTDFDLFKMHEFGDQTKLHFKTSVDDSSRIFKIFAADLNICDDLIVKAIRYPRPLSVSQALESIETELMQPSAIGKIIDIDLNNNTICDEGAGLIGDCFYSKSIIRILDLSYNRITDDGISNLINKLKPLLLIRTFECLIVEGNYGANRANIRKILSSFDQEEQQIISGKIKA